MPLFTVEIRWFFLSFSQDWPPPQACDVPSRFCLVMAGKGGGPFPHEPYGFDVTHSFAVQSEVMQFMDPNMTALRTQVLDYFNAQRKMLRKDHIIFNWERSMDLGHEEKMLKQVGACERNF